MRVAPHLATSVALLLACGPIAAAEMPEIQPQARAVGCPVNEQSGPARLLPGELMPAPVEPHAAQQLAYYQAAHSPGVFAPKGWSCRAWYGWSGSVLVVTPKLLQPPYFPLPMITGPAVTIDTSNGSSSGRFHIAIVAQQLFPVFGSAFITRVKQEHLLPNSTFAARLDPDDQLSYLSDRFVEYTTPANRTGVGTDGLLQASDLPIRGLSILTLSGQADLTELRVRLPANLNAVAAAVMQLETACVQLPQGCRGLQ